MWRRLSWTWALSASCIVACGRGAPRESPAGADPSSSADGAPAPACSDAVCAHLDGECVRGVCTDPGSSCRLVPVNEGEPCDEAGLCGPGRCEAGACRPLDSMQCAELDSACSEGYCEPLLGCVTRPRARPGGSCAEAVALDLAAGAVRERVDDSCGAPAPELAARGALGNAAYFLLDLTHAEDALDVELLVGATFRVASVLLRGECEDRTVLAYGTTGVFGADAGEVQLRHGLEPGRYWFAVAGVEASDRGAIEVAARVTPVEGAPSSETLRPCGEPIALRAEEGVEIRLDPIVPPRPSFWCSAEEIAPQRCYRLDLTGRPGHTLVDVQLEGAYATWSSTGSDIDDCSGSEEFSALLEPRVYDLYLSGYDGVQPALRIWLRDGEDCASIADAGCDGATPIDASLGAVTLRGNTACGAPYVDLPNGAERENQILYRLDLRSFSAPVRVEERDSGVWWITPFIAEPAEDPACARHVAFCGGSCTLAPREYLLGVEFESGPFELDLDFIPLEPATPTTCIPSEVIACAKSSVLECDTQGVNHPRCVGVLEECGLIWEPLKALCASHPECCDEEAGVSAGTDCEPLFLDAGARCPNCPRPECWF